MPRSHGPARHHAPLWPRAPTSQPLRYQLAHLWRAAEPIARLDADAPCWARRACASRAKVGPSQFRLPAAARRCDQGRFSKSIGAELVRAPSIESRRSLVAMPPFAEKPPVRPCAASTRWHGTTIGNGFCPSASPTARALARRPEPRRDLAVGEGRARRNRARDLVDAALERRHARPCRGRRRQDRAARPRAAPRCLRSRAAHRGGGGASSASGKRRRRRARVLASDDSGSCTPTTPRSPHAMPQGPDRRLEQSKSQPS